MNKVTKILNQYGTETKDGLFIPRDQLEPLTSRLRPNFSDKKREFPLKKYLRVDIDTYESIFELFCNECNYFKDED